MLVWTDHKIKAKDMKNISLDIIKDGALQNEAVDYFKKTFGIELDNKDLKKGSNLKLKTTSLRSDNETFFLSIKNSDSIELLKIKGKHNNKDFEKIYNLKETGGVIELPNNLTIIEINTAVEAYQLYTVTDSKTPIFERTPSFMTDLESNKTEKQIYDLRYDNYSQMKVMQNPYYFINHKRISGLGFYNSKTDGQFKYIETPFKNSSKKSQNAPLLSLLGADPELIYQNFEHIQMDKSYPKISISKITDSKFKIIINEVSSYYFNPQQDEIVFLRRKGTDQIDYTNNSKTNTYKMVYSNFQSIYEAQGYEYWNNIEISFVNEIILHNDKDSNYCLNGCYTSFTAHPKQYDLTLTLPDPELFILKNNITTNTIELASLLNVDNNFVEKTNNYNFLYESLGLLDLSLPSENIGVGGASEYIYDSDLELGARMRVSRSYLNIKVKNFTKPYKLSNGYNFSFRLIGDLSISEIRNEPQKYARGIGTVLINELRSSYGMFATTFVSNNSENSMLYNYSENSCFRIFGINGIKGWKNQSRNTFKDFWTLEYYNWKDYYKEKKKAVISAIKTDRIVNNFDFTRIQKRGQTKISLSTVDKFSNIMISHINEYGVTYPHWLWYNDVFIANPRKSYIDATADEQIPSSEDGYVDFPYNDDKAYRDDGDGYAIYIIRNQKL